MMHLYQPPLRELTRPPVSRVLDPQQVNKWSAQYVKSGAVREDLDAMKAASESMGGLIPRGGS